MEPKGCQNEQTFIQNQALERSQFQFVTLIRFRQNRKYGHGKLVEHLSLGGILIQNKLKIHSNIYSKNDRETS